MSKNKKWSSAAKFEIALEAIKGEITLNELCKKYDVAPSQVHAWKKQLLEQIKATIAFAAHLAVPLGFRK